MIFSRAFLLDAAERVFWTFVYAFVQALVLSSRFDVEGLTAAAVSAIPVALVVVKTLIASKIGDPDSAAIVKSDPTPAELPDDLAEGPGE